MKSIQASYDAFLRAHSKMSSDLMAWLDRELERKKVRFGAEIVPSFMKPYFVSERETHELKQVSRLVGSMLEKVVQAYFDHPELQPVFGVTKSEKPYVEMDPGYGKKIVIMRPDGFMEGGHMRFIEFNCDSPAGAGYSDVQENIMRRSLIMKQIGKPYQWGRVQRMDCLLRGLLSAWNEFSSRKAPQIAIVDWKHIRTRDEFFIIKDYFENKGYETVIADPRELKFKKGRLYFESFRVDLVYRRVIFKELWEKRNEVRDFLKAYRLGKVCVVNSFRSKLAANKAVLSILTNPVYNFLFSEDEIRMRERHIPWTRRVIDAKKFYGSQEYVLSETIDMHQKELVLKPAEGYGGRDVKIGKETSKAEWRRTIKRALRGGERWVVQAYVPIPFMKVPVLKRKKLKIVPKKINLNPFVFNNAYAGAMSRLSDASVINVSAGGGLIPAVSYKVKA